MATTHFTAWLVNAPSDLDGDFIDVTVLEDKAVSYDVDEDGNETPAWGTDSSKPTAFYAVTTVDAKNGDVRDAIDEAEELMAAAGWSVTGTWDTVPNAYIVTVERDAA